MRKYLSNKLFLLYLSKGITFFSNYLLIIILFNKLPEQEFSSYSAITYYTFIIYTILDFGYSNYVILNKEINKNEELLISLHRKKLSISIIIAIAVAIIYLLSKNIYFLFISIIALQQAFNFDGLFKIKNNYQIIIRKYFFTAVTNIILIGLAFYISLSYKSVVLYTIISAIVVNAVTLPMYVKENILSFRKAATKMSVVKLKKEDSLSLIFYFSFNFLNNFTYSYYAYASQFHCNATYYNSNMLYLNLISNLYVLYLICREYIFTTGRVHNYMINLIVAAFIVVGCLGLFNYGYIISFFGKSAIIGTSDKLIACGLFLTLVLKTETYFRLLKNTSYLKFVSLLQLVFNGLMFINSDALIQRFGKGYLLFPLIIFDCIIVLLSIVGFLLYKKLGAVSLASIKHKAISIETT